ADAARARDLWARSSSPGAAMDLHRRAAREYEDVGLPVHAAIAWAAGGEHASSVAAWQRVARDPRIGQLPYEQALAAYNLGLAERRAGHAAAEGRQLARAQRLIEEVADEFETSGQRERAFDCYAILLHLGRELGAFESLCEGYTNC